MDKLSILKPEHIFSVRNSFNRVIIGIHSAHSVMLSGPFCIIGNIDTVFMCFCNFYVVQRIPALLYDFVYIRLSRFSFLLCNFESAARSCGTTRATFTHSWHSPFCAFFLPSTTSVLFPRRPWTCTTRYRSGRMWSALSCYPAAGRSAGGTF